MGLLMLRMPILNKSIGQFDYTVHRQISALVLLNINVHIHPNPFNKGGHEGGIGKGSIPVFPFGRSLSHVQAHERCEVNRNTSLSLHKDKQVKFTNNRMTTIPWKEAVDDQPVEESKRIWEERSLDAPLREFRQFNFKLKIVQPPKIASALNALSSSWKIKDLSKLMRLKADSMPQEDRHEMRITGTRKM
ncbi:unnamed protein product [Linum trigynum]|uniref:Uncharacterized protein n=1 Tax=Linum trigynum TaxID=586398 RepID=A0AAV2CD60_9ROSI